MAEFLRAYRAKPWPKLEIPNLQRQHLISLVVFMAALITIGWLIWSSAQTRAVYFGLMGLAIPVFFLLKSRFVALIGLLTFEVILAFLFLGNASFSFMALMIVIGIVLVLQWPLLIYALLVFAVWFDTSPFVTGLTLRLEFIMGIGELAVQPDQSREIIQHCCDPREMAGDFVIVLGSHRFWIMVSGTRSRRLASSQIHLGACPIFSHHSGDRPRQKRIGSYNLDLGGRWSRRHQCLSDRPHVRFPA